MNSLKKLLKSTGFRKFLLISFTLLMALTLFSSLGRRAAVEAQQRKSDAAIAFEKAPEKWLTHPVAIGDFQKALDQKKIASVGVKDSLVLFTLKDGAQLSTEIPGCTYVSCSGPLMDSLYARSMKEGFTFTSIDIDPRTPTQRVLDGFRAMFGPLISISMLLLVMFLVMTMQRGGGDKQAKTLPETPDTRFKDVVGAEEAKAQMERVRTFLAEPGRYEELGASPPRGVLLQGPPGTGKTLLARALAGECGANFIAVDGSYFTSMFYGLGVRKVHQLFELARKNAPCVLFIDELDGVGRRTNGRDSSGGEAEQNRIINRILVEMDGFEARESVIVVGATNHVENIDPAMRRAGRFDSVVTLTLPSLPDRAALFEKYLSTKKVEPSVNFQALARMTQGMSPADVANTVNKAASKAAEAGASILTQEHLLQAVEAHQLGGEVNAIKGLMTEETRKRIAIHEAGHAIVAHLAKAGSVERVSIEPRGPALGVTYVSRTSEEPLYGQAELVSRIAMMLGGREAELLVLNSVSSGASDDLKRATALSVDMVSTLGFSPTFGLLSVAGVPAELLSAEVKGQVLSEARKLLEQAQMTCKDLLVTHRAALDSLTALLLAKETVSGPELLAALNTPAAPSFGAHVEITPDLEHG